VLSSFVSIQMILNVYKNSNMCKQMYKNATFYKSNIAGKSREHDVCHQTYVSSGVEFIHGSDKLYTCDVCNMTCSDASALSIHKQLHTGVKWCRSHQRM